MRKGRTFHLRFDEGLEEWIERKAKQEDRTKTKIVNRILKEAKDREEAERKP